MVPHIYVTRLPVKWTEDEKIFFQRNAFSVFHYCSTSLQAKIAVRKENWFFNAEEKGNFCKTAFFCTKFWTTYENGMGQTQRQAGHNQNSNTYLSSLKSLYKKAWVRGRGI